MTHDEVKSLFRLFIIAYEKFEALPEKLDLWARLLGDINYDHALYAAEEHIKTSKYPPTIAEIREAAYTKANEPRLIVITPDERARFAARQEKAAVKRAAERQASRDGRSTRQC
jgi:hypothetical protein